MVIALMMGRNPMKITCNREKVIRRVQKTSDDCCNEVVATDSCFIGKDKTKWGKVKSTTHIRRRWHNILTKLPGVTGQAGNATTPFEAWNSLITDGNTVRHSNQYILIIQRNFSRERDAKLTDEIEIKFFIRLLYLAGTLWSNT
jgi:hypothetical protein